MSVNPVLKPAIDKVLDKDLLEVLNKDPRMDVRYLLDIQIIRELKALNSNTIDVETAVGKIPGK